MFPRQPVNTPLPPTPRSPTFSLRFIMSVGCVSLLGGGTVFAQVGADSSELAVPSEPDLSGVPAEVIFNAPAESYYAEPYIEPSYVKPYEEPVYAQPEVPLPSVLEDLPAYDEPPPHSYIDETDYSLGATEAPLDYQAPVVLEERHSGCASSIAPGQALTDGICAEVVFDSYEAAPAPQHDAASPGAGGNGLPPAIESGRNGIVANTDNNAATDVYPTAAPVYSTESYPIATPSAAYSANLYPVNLSDRSSGVDPYTATGLSFAQIEAQMLRNIATMPLGRIGNGDRHLLFPVSVPSPISSFFGFRIHPIAQVQRLHTGTDIAAPYGTPVLAAFSGEVVESSALGGYGLTVILSHNGGMSETLYAHLSELLVEVGETVSQGDPLGRVGSTGFSTGPHLHFEVKQMTDMGWVYLDANRQLEVALERLIDSSQLAQLPQLSRDSSL